MDQIYLFTWNLHGSAAAYDLAVDHLAQRGTTDLFVACFQELPSASSVARARTSAKASDSGASVSANARRAALLDLDGRHIKVIETSAVARGLALVHHPGLAVQRVEVDEDDEFVAAVFQLPASKKQVGVVGLHALSQVDMHKAEDQGGSRALLRHAINELRLNCDHIVVLGDFNSSLNAREITSWHCFYVLNGAFKPHLAPSRAQRRGLDHPALYSVLPSNAPAMGTLHHEDTGGYEKQTVDFIAVDKGIHEAARSQILTMVSAQSIWDSRNESPTLGDHLPVEGTVSIF